MHGVVNVFWQSADADESRLMEARVWGCRGSLAAPGAETVRYGGNTSCIEVRLSKRPCARARRRNRHPPARRGDGRTTRSTRCTSSSRTCTWTICRGSGSSVRCSGPASTCTSGDRRRRCRASPIESRSTSRRRCSRCASPTSRRTSRSTTPRRSRSSIGSATVRAANVAHQGPTVGYRIEEGGRSLAYLPDHEPSLGVELR